MENQTRKGGYVNFTILNVDKEGEGSKIPKKLGGHHIWNKGLIVKNGLLG